MARPAKEGNAPRIKRRADCCRNVFDQLDESCSNQHVMVDSERTSAVAERHASKSQVVGGYLRSIPPTRRVPLKRNASNAEPIRISGCPVKIVVFNNAQGRVIKERQAHNPAIKMGVSQNCSKSDRENSELELGENALKEARLGDCKLHPVRLSSRSVVLHNRCSVET